jgi:hypothetical protein
MNEYTLTLGGLWLLLFVIVIIIVIELGFLD